METKLTWIGFGVGVLCVLLAALGYRISWEFEDGATRPEQTRQQQPQQPAARPAAPAGPRTLPLERLEGPPAAVRRPARPPQPPTPTQAPTEDE